MYSVADVAAMARRSLLGSSVLAALVGLSWVPACGLEDGTAALGLDPQERLPLLVELSTDLFPRQTTIQLSSGAGWVESHVHVQRGTPVRISAPSNVEIGLGGFPETVAGEGALAPLEVDGALLLRVGSRVVRIDGERAFYAPHDAELVFGFNWGAESRQSLGARPSEWEINLGWGTPQTPHAPALAHVSVASERETTILDVEVSALVDWIDPFESPTLEMWPGDRLGRRIRRVGGPWDRGLYPRLLPGERAPDLLRASANALLIRIGGHGGQISSLWGGTVIHVPGGDEVAVRLSDAAKRSEGSWSGADEWQGDEEGDVIEIEMLDRFGSMMNLLPWEAFDTHRQGTIRPWGTERDWDPYGDAPGLQVRRGELIRVGVSGYLRGSLIPDTPSDVDADGVLRRVPEDDGSWRIPGARMLAVMIGIDGAWSEVGRDRTLVAPRDGRVNIVINACREEERPARTMTNERCEARLGELSGELFVRVAVAQL